MGTTALHDRRVLVVEDDYLIATFLAEALEQEGAHVVGPVGSLDEAISTVEANDRIDAAVLDVNLQGEEVFPVADRLRDRGVPFLFTSGYDASCLPDEHAQRPLCLKPYISEEAVERLGRILELLPDGGRRSSVQAGGTAGRTRTG